MHAENLEHPPIDSQEAPEAPFSMKDIPPEEREAYWYKHVYRPNTKQLTLRVIVMGIFLGAIMSVSNLYVGLMTGWGFGVTITAGILAFAIFKALERWLPGGHFTDLENNAMQSVASAAGAMSSSGLVSAVPALLMLNGTEIPPVWLALYLGAVSMLGVVIAIPLKRQMINIDQLPFPSGIAAAETIKSLHFHGEEATRKARALAMGGLFGAAVAYFRDANAGVMAKVFPTIPVLQKIALPSQFPPDPSKLKFLGIAWDKLTLGADMSLMLYAAGAIIGIRTGVSLLIGAILNWVFVAPWLITHHISVPKIVAGALNFQVIQGGYKTVAAWSTWPGVGMLLTATLLGLALQWKSLLRGFIGIANLAAKTATGGNSATSAIEVPGSWLVGGLVVAGTACVLLQAHMFHIPPMLGILAVIFAVVLSVVAARITGETDITPIGAMGKVTQLGFAALSPGHAVTNLMAANVTAGAAAHTADLLTDLKSGYLLGANPRQQFLAQFFGVAVGTLVCVPAYHLLVPNASVLGTKFAAPSAIVWKATAEVLSYGLAAIPPTALMFMGFTIAFAVLTTLLDNFWPASRRFLPSATGIGLAMVLPFTQAFAIFAGSLIGWLIMTKGKSSQQELIIPVASGLIAGESLMAVAIAALQLFHII